MFVPFFPKKKIVQCLIKIIFNLKMRKSALILGCILSLALAGCFSQEAIDDAGRDSQTSLIKTAGLYDTFAQCLSEKGVKLYTTSWCPHCKDQKALFGSSIKHLELYTCDEKDKDACDAAGVQIIPAWSFPGQDQLVEEVLELDQIAEFTGCEL
jgi:thiol-disulfide isomerase/thioredoxin